MFSSFLAIAATASMQPTGSWMLDFAENACVLSMQYGAPETGFVLHFRPQIVGPNMEIVIDELEKSPKDAEWVKGWIEAKDGRRIEPIMFLSYSTVSGHRLASATVSSEAYAVGADGERIKFHVGEQGTYDLAIPGFHNARAALETCQKDLRQAFGVTDKDLAKISTPAKPSLELLKYFSVNDYPEIALRQNEQGTVGILYWIESDGRAKDCKVLETSHYESLDVQTCRVVINRSRFEPALDSKGRPVRSPQYQRIRWELPR